MGSWRDSDEPLIERARRGDRAALQELWRAHRRWVAAIILAHRPRSVELEDLLQDVAMRLLAKMHTLRESRAFRPWLRQIAVNVCRGAGRSTRSGLQIASEERHDGSAHHPGQVSEPPAAGPESSRIVERGEAARRLLEQALTLPAAYREPLLLRCLRDMTYQQISETLDLPLTTIETRLARARRMLREELGEDAAAEVGVNRCNPCTPTDRTIR